MDDDDGNIVVEGDGTAREHQLMWNAELNENWHDPSGFGTAVLAGQSLGVKKTEQSVSKFTIYPNPTNGLLTIRNTENVELVEVYSLTGQKVMTIDNEFAGETVLNVSSINPGVYVIKLIEKDGNTGAVTFIKE